MIKPITIAATFILGVGAGWVIKGELWNIFLTSYIPALATLLAAFYGAKYAFQFQREKEKNDQEERNLINANLAMFNLSMMANTLFLYQRDIINLVRNSPARFLELRPTLGFDKKHIELNTDTLGFLLGTEHANLLGEIACEAEKYKSAVDAINHRSELHIKIIQPQLEKARPPNQASLTIKEIEECLGERLSSTLHQSTDQVIDHVDNALVSIQAAAQNLHTVIKKLYPKSRVIRFSLPDNNE